MEPAHVCARTCQPAPVSRCWQKTQTPQVRDNDRRIAHCGSRFRTSAFCPGSLRPDSSVVVQTGRPGAAHGGPRFGREAVDLGKPKLLPWTLSVPGLARPCCFCPGLHWGPPRHMGALRPSPVNVTLLGSRVFADGQDEVIRVALTQCDQCP